MTHSLTNQQVEKLGNAIIYLSKRVGELSKTKILKLLFLLEEASIKKFGYPFFGVDFQLWKHGPVLKDVFIDLSDEEPTLLKPYIKRTSYNTNEFEAAAEFSDDEFSDNDIFIMDTIAKFAKNQNASDLVRHTHNENSLWRKSAAKAGILDRLEEKSVNNTDYIIDFSLLFESNEFLRQKYENTVENIEFSKSLKR